MSGQRTVTTLDLVVLAPSANPRRAGRGPSTAVTTPLGIPRHEIGSLVYNALVTVASGFGSALAAARGGGMLYAVPRQSRRRVDHNGTSLVHDIPTPTSALGANRKIPGAEAHVQPVVAAWLSVPGRARVKAGGTSLGGERPRTYVMALNGPTLTCGNRISAGQCNMSSVAHAGSIVTGADATGGPSFIPLA